MNNRLHNASNPYQGDYKKVLCVCSAGLLRSPTVAYVLSQEPYNFNTRAVGLDADFALIVIDKVLVHWADEIIVMTERHIREIEQKFNPTCPIINLDISDSFNYRDSELIKLIKERYRKPQGVL